MVCCGRKEGVHESDERWRRDWEWARHRQVPQGRLTLAKETSSCHLVISLLRVHLAAMGISESISWASPLFQLKARPNSETTQALKGQRGQVAPQSTKWLNSGLVIIKYLQKVDNKGLRCGDNSDGLWKTSFLAMLSSNLEGQYTNSCGADFLRLCKRQKVRIFVKT